MLGDPFDTHSPEAKAIGALFDQTLIVCGAILLVVTTLVVVCIVRFRAKAGVKEDPVQHHGNTRLEIAWTIAPFLVLVWLFWLTVKTVMASDPPPDRAPDLTVIAHQWWWEARYATGAVTANEIHIPVGRKLLVEIRSADVIHDFWVPQLARKVDATPGRSTFIWLEADASGTYLGACAEYCGTQHAWMRIMVVAEPEAEFVAWEAHEREPAAPTTGDAAARGARLFADMTCVKCHGIATGQPSDAALPHVAPDLTHIARRRTLAAGRLDNNHANLAAWLKDPQALKQGSHMPSLQLTDAKVDDLTAYFESLK